MRDPDLRGHFLALPCHEIGRLGFWLEREKERERGGGAVTGDSILRLYSHRSKV